MSETAPSGPVDRYLDDLFDRLAGTGGIGRRALAETEDHLRTAAADAAERGMPPAEAEREAVARFGAAGSFARRLRRAHRHDPLRVLLSSAWLLVGLALAALSAVYLLTAVDRAVEMSRDPSAGPECDRTCYTPSGALRHLLLTGAGLAVVAAAVLVGRVLARRRNGLPPSASPLPAVVSVLGGLAAFAGFYIFGAVAPLDINPYVVGGDGPGYYFSFLGTVTGAAACLAGMAWAVVRHRRGVLPVTRAS